MTEGEIAIDALAHLKDNGLAKGTGCSESYKNSQFVSAGGGSANQAVDLAISLLPIVGVPSSFYSWPV